MKTKVLLIDDEPLARDLVRAFLNDFPEIEIIGECADGFQALKTIQELNPDLIFLDVQMPKLTGFELLEVLDHPPLVIFATAYDQFAIRAFENNAIDYLLKPFSKERFASALNKALERINNKAQEQEKVQKLIKSPEVLEHAVERIVVKNGSKVKVLPVESLIYLEAQDDYVMIYNQEGKFLKQQTMKFFEEQLDSNKFIRIHRSYIVNIEQIAQIEPYEKDSYRLILKNKASIPISRTGYSKLKEKLGI